MSPVRAMVRTVGELLVSAGVLILLFLLWQVAWTDVVADRSQERTTDALLQQWNKAAEPAAEPLADATAGPAPAPAPEPASLRPAALEELPSEALAVLRVPAFGDDYLRPVLQGTTDAVLQEGIGHYEDTAGPGEVGNFAVAGHRTTYGAPFNPIADLELGDAVMVETAETFYVYRVESTKIVRPEDVDVIAPVPGSPGAEPSQAYLTMTSCHPMYSARQRYIVHAVLESTSPRADGVPEVLA